MIIDRPLGWGFGNFEFAFVSYSHSPPYYTIGPQTLFKAPHNEFLRSAAEGGVLFFALIIFILIKLSKLFVKYLFSSGYDEMKAIFTLAFIPIIMESFFQFPFHLPFPLLIIPLYMAVALKTKQAIFVAPQYKAFKNITVGILSIWLLLFSIRKGIADILPTFFPNDYDVLQTACTLQPDSWRHCLSFARYARATGDFTEAEKVTNRLLNRNSTNFVALSEKIELLRQQKKYELMCLNMGEYISIIGRGSSYHLEIKNACAVRPSNK